MIRTGSKNSVWIFIFFILAFVITAKLAFNLFAYSVVRAIYEGKAGFLNRIIESADSFPIEHYYAMADKFFYILIAIIVCLIIALRLKVLKLSLISILIAFTLLEGLIAMMLAFPGLSRYGLRKVISKLYTEKTRNIVQLDHGRYDNELTYTLAPGEFIFSNPEFRNKYYVNKSGLRDDEDSLIAPDAIVLGDSYAMGWGVEQKETYAQIIESESGLKVLNAAISSYGTVREMRLLKRIDTSNLKWLIMHYCGNDYTENEPFYNGTFAISSQERYNDIIAEYKKNKRYYPGKYIIDVIKGADGITEQGLPDKNEAKYFLNAVIKSKVRLDGVKIIVIGESGFISSLKNEIESKEYPDYIKLIKTVDFTEIKNRDECLFILDEHLNAKGHNKIAEKLLAIIREEGKTTR